jgi:shikimate kinase
MMSGMGRRPIALIGLMGAGKSAVARLLGERLGASMADLDAMVEAAEGCAVAEIFARSGEAHFRSCESELLVEVLRTGVRVIACGGGIVLDPENRRALREHCRVVWLDVSPAEAARRVSTAGGAGAERPLLAGGAPQERLAALLAVRAPLYAETAHLRVVTDGLSCAEVVERILAPESPGQ